MGMLRNIRKGVGTRKFNGDIYHPQEFYVYKSEAKAHTTDMRKRGFKARIVKMAGGYMVYFRAKRDKLLLHPRVK